MRRIKIIIVLGCAALLFTGCGTVNVASKWADNKITVDGVDDEWQSGAYYLKDHNLLLGIKNDDENFYFAMITSDETNIHQILTGGLTLWFDNDGGSDKKFGVRFPLGLKLPGMRPGTNASASGLGGEEEGDEFPGTIKNDSNGKGKAPGQGVMPAPDFSQMEASFSDLEILNEKDTSRMSADAARGIAVKMKVINDKLVYEFKIPLKSKDNSYAIDVNKNNEFTLGIETSVSNKKTNDSPGGDMPDGGDMPGGGPGGMPPGGGGPGGPGGPGGMPPRGRGFGGHFPREALSYWLNVILAHK
jgi:hypothetical protein